MNRLLILFVIVAAILSSYSANASQLLRPPSVDTTETKESKENSDPLGRSNPKGTVRGFFKSLAGENRLQAAQYMDLSTFPNKDLESEVKNLVRKLELALDRSGQVLPINLISSNPDGNLNDGLNPVFEEVGTIVLQGNEIPLLLELITTEDNQKKWLFSWKTLQVLTYEEYANDEVFLEKPPSDGMLSSRWQGGPVRDWIGIILIGLGSYLVAWLITLFLGWFVRLWWKNFTKSEHGKVLKTLLIPLRLVLVVAILVYVARAFGISIVVRQAFGVVNVILLWIALFIFMWLLINTLSSYGEQRLRESNRFGGLSAISFFRNSAKFILVLVALLIALDTVGVNVTAGLAALGIGGIALALGAQKTIENIVGGLSVVFDQPVSVGDFCKFGDTLGTVEKIGMFSTRIRTLSRTLVTIPNADFSTQLIENYAKRDMFWYHTVLGLRYETTADQMRYILVELRKILYAHPKVDPDPARVRFLGYGSDSLQVELFAYTHAEDWNDFLGIQEDINLRLAKVIEDSGSGFAFPSQTLYLSRDQGLSQEKKEEAEKRVREWIENNELKLPNFDADTIASLKGSIKYPPEGTDLSKNENNT
ncbi:mechanosensitive ion channel family protein [Lentiprolixibacter aurantiacus]|uniref:Mechanosensitive ion channel family protein n=1 Tax=Lentiprolixibacter aurantiacus TaxID=2993939 RepID=A0AAE3MMS9_9FLAO|nr:mechanosensitive ion channel family protein [Lentiprolixibacter aurantiacus]MCX2720611.1 mechanosensitive ion channel family protein [Lentiprolixibacter aurantiacus]